MRPRRSTLIFDFLPSILCARRKLIHVLKKQSKRPNLLIVERILPRRHAGPTDAMLDFPERHTFGIVFDTLRRQLRWARIEAFGDRGSGSGALHRTVTNCTVLRIKIDAADEIFIGHCDRVGTFWRFAI